MPVSGLVITFDNAVAEYWQSVKRLKHAQSIEVGEPQGHRLPIVMDTPSQGEDQRLRKWVQDLPGVVLVDVVFVGFEDQTAATDSTPAP